MRTILVISTFLVVTADVFGQLAEKAADLAILVRLPLLFCAFSGAVLVGAIVAHALLSLIRRTDLITDLIQEEPVEQLAS